jgi:S-adenosyl methyltransferase
LSAGVRIRRLPEFQCLVHDGSGEVTTGRKDAMETGFALSEIDTTTPHPARMYDALLGGKDNYAADRQAVQQLLEVAPEARYSARPTGRSCSGRYGS